MSLPSVTRAEAPRGAVERARGVSATPYDFRRPIQLSREHQRVLQVAFDAFARQATTVFTSALRTICSVTLTTIEQRSYAEHVDSLSTTSYLTLFTTEPMPGLGLLDLPLDAVMACVDHMLGGPGDDAQPQRPLTDIEAGIARGHVDRLLSEMRYSMETIVPIDPQVTGVEYNPQFAQVAAAGDVMVVIELELRIDDRPHRMTVCLPFTALHPHLATAAAPAPVSGRERAQRAEAAVLLQRSFEEVPVDIAVRFRTSRVTPASLADLQCGDVLRLVHPSAAPLDVTVGGQVFAHATAGSHGTRLAALVVAVLTDPTASSRPQEDR